MKIVCDVCGRSLTAENAEHFEETTLCTECYSSEVLTCDSCHNQIWEGNNAGSEDVPLCPSCFDFHYNACETCGRIIHNEDSHYLEGDDCVAYCERCFDAVNESYIEPYHYKPDPQFYGEGERYFGVELEVDKGKNREAVAKELLEKVNQKHEHIYIKQDSSLNHGMEIVTHPMTLDFHKNKMDWKSTTELCRKGGFRSHMVSTCGLHVHVSRDGLGKDKEEQEETISRILFIVEKFWDELLRFSRRTPSQLERWAARYGRKDSPKEYLTHAKGDYIGRYTCVNLHNRSTIEFRLFRGTLKLNTILATLEMVEHICQVALTYDDISLQIISWNEFTSLISKEIDPELIQYLKERGLLIEVEETTA